MATNMVHELGRVITITNASGKIGNYSAGNKIASGAVVELNGLIVIAAADIADGESGEAYIEGVFSVPKVTAAVWDQGDAIIWDKSAGKFDDAEATPATGDITGAVIAWTAGANNETTGYVKLTPGKTTVT